MQESSQKLHYYTWTSAVLKVPWTSAVLKANLVHTIQLLKEEYIKIQATSIDNILQQETQAFDEGHILPSAVDLDSFGMCSRLEIYCGKLISQQMLLTS